MFVSFQHVHQLYLKAFKGGLGQVVSSYQENKYAAYISYDFEEPGSMTLNAEYYVISTFGLMGVIGGTLGMFVEFEFYMALSSIINFVKGVASKSKGRMLYS